jgi:hypothetical protein
MQRLLWLVVWLSVSAMLAAVRVVPTPQYLEPLDLSVTIAHGGACAIVLGPARTAPSEKMQLAAEAIRRELLDADSSLRVEVRSFGEDVPGARIFLWNYSLDSKPVINLNLLDRETLTAPAHTGQSYLVRTPDARSVWVIGSSDQGVLWGAMTVLQLIRKEPQGVGVSGVYISDYPAFEFRAASDWLLNVEGNRWALDRGQGIEAYARTCEQKLDRAVRYKINMVLLDGFGWSLEQRFAGYPELMRRLNRYARARGIHLIFGGYGASYGMAYQHGPLYEEGAYLGKVFENRERYPDGPVYRCMGFPTGRKGVDPATLGSCRGNEALNRLKAEELRKFVEAVEPGALYIHHEDLGGYSGTQQVWLERCSRCRSRWPNDLLAAPDGGAGGLANGYSALVRAVRSVKNPATGYDAARDCQIILVSPVYSCGSPNPDDWSKVMELWRNIGEQIPRGDNVQVCFREIFPQKYSSAKWTETFNSMMRRAGVNIGIYMFFAGGADNFINDYPFTGVPALNAMFRGARTIYNFTGDFYTEPMEIINAEYDWNVHSSGFFRDPTSNTEAVETWRRFMSDEDEPRELLAPGGLFHTACDLLYGPKAGPIMAEYYRTFVPIPDVGQNASEPKGRSFADRTYLPMTFNRAYATPSHWRHLALDSKTWGKEISNEAYARGMETLKIDRQELHRRLAHRWGLVAGMNRKGAKLIDQALASDPLLAAVEDLRFLQTSFQVYQPMLEALEQFHGALRLHFAGKAGAQWQSGLGAALAKAKQAQQLSDQSFPQPIDPIGAEVGSLRKHARRLVESIEMWMAKSQQGANQ